MTQKDGGVRGKGRNGLPKNSSGSLGCCETGLATCGIQLGSPSCLKPDGDILRCSIWASQLKIVDLARNLILLSGLTKAR